MWNREESIHREAVNDRAANGGQLTGQEHQQVNQRQNNVGRSIYNDRHNENPEAHAQAEAEEGGGGTYDT